MGGEQTCEANLAADGLTVGGGFCGGQWASCSGASFWAWVACVVASRASRTEKRVNQFAALPRTLSNLAIAHLVYRNQHKALCSMIERTRDVRVCKQLSFWQSIVLKGKKCSE